MPTRLPRLIAVLLTTLPLAWLNAEPAGVLIYQKPGALPDTPPNVAPIGPVVSLRSSSKSVSVISFERPDGGGRTTLAVGKIEALVLFADRPAALAEVQAAFDRLPAAQEALAPFLESLRSRVSIPENDAPTPAPARPPRTPKPAEPDAPANLAGRWSGTYEATQGLTNIVLTLQPTGETNTYSGEYKFSAHPSNPGVPSGSFTVTATFDPATSAIVVKGEKWKQRPSGYAFADLVGNLSSDKTALTGDVTMPALDNQKVGSFVLEKDPTTP